MKRFKWAKRGVETKLIKILESKIEGEKGQLLPLFRKRTREITVNGKTIYIKKQQT